MWGGATGDELVGRQNQLGVGRGRHAGCSRQQPALMFRATVVCGFAIQIGSRLGAGDQRKAVAFFQCGAKDADVNMVLHDVVLAAVVLNTQEIVFVPGELAPDFSLAAEEVKGRRLREHCDAQPMLDRVNLRLPIVEDGRLVVITVVDQRLGV